MSIYFRSFFIVKSSIYDGAWHDFGLQVNMKFSFSALFEGTYRNIDKNLILLRNVGLLFPQNQTIQERLTKGIKTGPVTLERDSQNHTSKLTTKEYGLILYNVSFDLYGFIGFVS